MKKLPFDPETDTYTLPSGRTLKVLCGQLGVPMNTDGEYWQFTEGWDGGIDMEDWTLDDVIALCEHVIAQASDCLNDLRVYGNYSFATRIEPSG